jgi:RNA polymerase sigma-70 factor (ECF subfamily)
LTALLPRPAVFNDKTPFSIADASRHRHVAETFAGRSRFARPALVNGVAGAVWAPGGQPRVVFAFTITRGKIAAIDLVADPERLGQLNLIVLEY